MIYPLIISCAKQILAFCTMDALPFPLMYIGSKFFPFC